jgi:hypothetical protein
VHCWFKRMLLSKFKECYLYIWLNFKYKLVKDHDTLTSNWLRMPICKLLWLYKNKVKLIKPVPYQVKAETIAIKKKIYIYIYVYKFTFIVLKGEVWVHRQMLVKKEVKSWSIGKIIFISSTDGMNNLNKRQIWNI